MLFGKSKETPQVPATLEWPDTDRKYQRVRVVVQKCVYSVTGSYGKWNLEFEGTAQAIPLSGLQIVVSLEALTPFETPRRLLDHWKTFPEAVEGTCHLQQMDSPLHPSCFNVTLYCEIRAVEPILQALALLNNSSTAVVIDLELDTPDAAPHDFWRNAWQTEELRIRSWRIICEAKQKGAQ